MKTDDTPGLYWDAYEGTLAPPSGSAARNLAAIRQRLAAGERVSAAPAQPQPAPPRAAAAVLLWWGKSASASVGLGIGALLTVKVAVMGVQALSPTPTGAQPVVAGTPAAAAPVVAPQPRGGPTPESPEAEAVIVDPSGARSPTV
nr:hypothetical protein [Deltaproteobacteria bacterium]